MVRISKAPEVRKQEIICAAMKLFYTKGYEETSIADIAKEMNVVPGLCYRYFKSKKELFEIAMDSYVKECSEKFLKVICDDKKSLKERMEDMTKLMLTQDDKNKYHDFYHKSGNEIMHEQLSIKIAKYLMPGLIKEIEKSCEKGEIHVQNAEIITNFIMYGQIGVLSCTDVSMEEKIKQIHGFIKLLIYIK